MVRHYSPRKEPPKGTMAMYAIGILPLIHRLDQQVKQVWYADDATTGGKLRHLYSWWNQLLRCGPEYGYHANASKTWLVVKQEHLPLATEIFADPGVQITVEGRRHLGVALGTSSFIKAMSRKKSKNGWEKLLDYLPLLPANHMLHMQLCLTVSLANGPT